MPTPSELEGQAHCHSYLLRVLGPGNLVRSVPNGIPVSAKDEEERGRLIRLNRALASAGMTEGTPDHEIIGRSGRAHLIEFKKEGETLSSLSVEQEDQIILALEAGAKVGLAHTVDHEVEELLLIWGFELRYRLPPRPAHIGRALRWPLEGERLREAIHDAKRKRAIRNTEKITREVRMPPSENE